MIRSIFYLIHVVITTIFGGIIVISIGIFKKHSRFSYEYVVRNWTKLQLKVAGIEAEVSGTENIDPNRPYVIVCNHQSQADIPILLNYVPIRMTIIAKKELFKIPLFGRAMRSLGILEIDRSNRRKSIETLNKAAEILHKENLSVLAFPEGTRSLDGNLKPFKKGAFMLALNAGMPILPISLRGTFPLLPKGSLLMNKGRVQITFHPPVETSEYNLETRNQLIEDVHRIISEGFYAESHQPTNAR